MDYKNILLTGISRGLGLVIARVALQKGYHVYGIARTVSPELKALLDLYPNQLFTLSYDLSNADQIKTTIFAQWLKDIPIYAYVNNAAMAYDTLITNIDHSTLSKMTTVNQIAPMMMTKYVIRNMILHNTQGSIVHLSSVSVHTGYKGLAMYAATKGALEAFSKNAAREWGSKGIRSNCIAAGFMDTDMTSSMDESSKEKIVKRTALKQETSIASVAASVLYLISDASASMTGQVLYLDGGTI